MKKGISMLLTLIMIISLVGCGSKTNKLIGTWKVDSAEIDGTKFTASELEAMGDDSLSGGEIVIKDGGKAYVSDGDSGDVVDWTETENGVKIGEQECTMVDGMICLEYGKGKVYFKKVSDSQTIGDTQEKEEETSSNNTESSETSVTIQSSTDKYTWYIKNYVGKNCASLGYTSMGGDRMDRYGEGLIELVFVTPDGTYVDIENDDDLKQYSVTGQSIEPNTEMKFTFLKDSEGKEYDNLVASQTYEEIVLSVKKVGDSNTKPISLTTIKASPDKYTWYIADYVGRNLSSCGYTSLGGDLMHKYGDAVVKLVIVSDDGSYIDPEDTEALKNYVVTAQNISPNTELNLVYVTDSNGDEYDNLVSSQNIEEVELTVKPIKK